MFATHTHFRWSRQIPAIFLLLGLSLLAKAEDPELTAESMMVHAHEARAVWRDLPGFSAEIVVSTNGAVAKGRMIVTAEGDLKLNLPDSPNVKWAEHRLQSLVNHRLPPKGKRKFNVSFADDIETHPLGRLIRFHDNRLHSVYRIQDDVITEVHRTMGPTRFTISVTDVSHNAEGKYLPKSYSVSWWDTKSGNLTACETIRNQWVRVSRWDLPARLLSVRTEDDGQRVVGQIVFRNHRLLKKPNENWPSFQNGGNTSIDSRNLPLHWTPKKGVAWRLELPGYGQSAPVVWRDRIYLTTVEGDNKETNIVSAFDAKTGKSLWKQKFPATVKVKNSYMVSRAAPTPLADSEGLYVLFESGDLHALSHDGRLRWRKSFFDDADRAFKNGHGYGASPTQTDDAVIVLVDHRGPSYLTAVSKQTGKPLWKTGRTPRSSWASPQVTRVGNQRQVIVSSAGSVDGYDVDTGRKLWSHKGISGNRIPSATIQGDRVFVGASISRDKSNAGSVASSNCCLQITPGKEPGYKLHWQAEKAVCDYVSPLVHRGHVYYVNKVGVLYCLDAATGRQCYVQRIGNPCWAQPIAAGERVYFFGKNGITTVVRAGPIFERLASNHLWSKNAPPMPRRSYEYEPQDESDTRQRRPSLEYLDPIVYGVAAVEGAFYIRLGTHLYCIAKMP